jgi:hypothetical protein
MNRCPGADALQCRNYSSVQILVNAAGNALSAQTGEQQRPPTAEPLILTHDGGEIIWGTYPTHGFEAGKP